MRSARQGKTAFVLVGALVGAGMGLRRVVGCSLAARIRHGLARPDRCRQGNIRLHLSLAAYDECQATDDDEKSAEAIRNQRNCTSDRFKRRVK